MANRVVSHRISSDEQLRQWVAGNSMHRHTNSKYVKDGECCPDFSCCQSDLLATLEERQAFVTGDKGARNRWLFVFLKRALEAVAKKPDLRVHVVSDTPPGRDN